MAPGTGRRSPAELLVPGRPLTLAGVADGAEGLVVADLARAVAARADAPATSLVVVCRDGPRMAALARALAFFAPDLEVLEFPAWDCLPYDRVSPHAGVVAQRMTTLSRLARVKGRDRPSVLLTTVNAALQRVPRARLRRRRRRCRSRPATCSPWTASRAGSSSTASCRASTVREPGDYAVRGGILDLFAPGMAEPVRLDFFGDTLETIRSFDPETPAHDRPAARARSRAGRRVPAHDRDDQALPPRLCRGVRRADARRSALRGGERRPPPSRHGALAAAVPRPARDAVRLSARRAGRAGAAGRGCRARAPRADRRLLRGARSRCSPQRDGGAALQAAAAGPALSRRSRVARAARRRRAGAAHAVCRAGRAGAGRSMSAPGRGAISPPSAPSPAATCSTR